MDLIFPSAKFACSVTECRFHTKPLTARGVQFYGEEEMKMQSCPEVDGVAYMPGVYKRLMVRMSERTDELANVRA